jgi:hypothetical protein
MNNEETVLLVNTEDKLRTPAKYALDILWSNWKTKNKIREKLGRGSKKKREAVDIVLPCKKRRGTATKL